jgi:DNA end-binding protein Ku
MRSIWSGSISFGLINIPVKLFSASSSEEQVSFDLLHKKDLSPIKYVKYCETEGKPVSQEDIVKGYEYEKGSYIILTEDEIKKANVKKAKTIDIQAFVENAQIDSMYFEKPYYLSPDKGAEKAYALLREALIKTDKVALCKFVLRSRENLAVIKPQGESLVLNQMRYAYEIKKPSDLEFPEKKIVSSGELDMAVTLVNQLTQKFDPEKYRDTFKVEVEKMVEAKAKGAVPIQKGQAPEASEVKDLMSLLKESIKTQEHHAQA